MACSVFAMYLFGRYMARDSNAKKYIAWRRSDAPGAKALRIMVKILSVATLLHILLTLLGFR